jgi:hypothetical protein
MTKPLAPRAPANPRTLLTRILDQPNLVSAVQALPPAALLRLIDRVGLEDAGELVALTTVDQLRRVFDEDVWQSDRPGSDERFDPARFTVWLEIMLEAGERFTADKLAELPADLVELALHHHVLVISLEELALLISEGEGQVPLEKVVGDSPYLELGDYCVIGRSWEGWETITTVLLALDERHSNTLQPMLERLWRVTSDYVYGQGGLFNVLTSEEMLQSDAAADREERRERAGFVAASSARAFLSLARKGAVSTVLQDPTRDPITSAFFRYSETVPVGVGAAATAPEADRLAALLGEVAGEVPGDVRSPRLLDSGPEEPATQTLLTRALVALAEQDAGLHAERARELGYLANVLLAGAGARGARLRPLDAAQATLATCNLGLERALADASSRARPETRAVRQVERLSCDVLFRVGWRLLHEQVSRPAAAAAERVARRAAGDALDARSLALRAALRDDVPALLSADGTAPEWIATTAQLLRARTFLGGL